MYIKGVINFLLLKREGGGGGATVLNMLQLLRFLGKGIEKEI